MSNFRPVLTITKIDTDWYFYEVVATNRHAIHRVGHGDRKFVEAAVDQALAETMLLGNDRSAVQS